MSQRATSTHSTPPATGRSSQAATAAEGVESGRGYFMSSIDLQSGLEVSEDELHTLPAEFADVFGAGQPG